MVTKNDTYSLEASKAATGQQSVRDVTVGYGSSRSGEAGRANAKSMTVAEFDAAFDNGEDVDHLIDWSSAKRINEAAKRVNVDFPLWMVRALDAQAKKRGVTRQALIKMWLADRLEATPL